MLRRDIPDKFIAIATLLVAAVSFASFGCNKKPTWQEPGPAATFETFLMDWYRGSYKAAFETIAPEDRERLTEPLEELEGKLDDENLPEEVDMLVVGRVDNPYDIKDVELTDELTSAPQKGQKVTLEIIYHDGREGEATLIWGGDQWFVDLPLAAKRDAENAQAPDPDPSQPDPSQPATSRQAPSTEASADAGPDETDQGNDSDDSTAGDAGPPNSNEEQQDSKTP